MRDKDHLIKHGTIMLAATVLSGVFNYGFQILMVRMLRPVDFGILFSLTAVFMIISLPAGTIQTVIAKYISKFKARKENGKMSYLLIHTTKKMCGILSILLVIFILMSKFIAGFLKIDALLPVIIVGPVIFTTLLFPINFGALQGLERFTEIGTSQVLGAVTRVLIGVILVYIGWGVSGALFGGLLSGFFVIGFTWWALRDILSVRDYDKNIGKQDILKYTKPVAVAYLCFGVSCYIDAVIVKHYFNELLAGYYSIVSMIGKAFLFPSMSFSAAMFPKVSGIHEEGKYTRYLLFKTLIYSGIVCVLGILLCIVFARPLVYILMRKADITEDTFKIMIPLLRFVGFAITPYGLACIVINYYLAQQWNSFLPYLIFGTILQIVLLVLFHNTLIQVLTVLFIAGIFILLCGVPGKCLKWRRNEFRKHSKKD